MRFEMASSGASQTQPQTQQHQQQQQQFQTTYFGGGVGNNTPSSLIQRPMNLYTKTNHNNGIILNTNNLIATQNAINNNNHHLNNNHCPVISDQGTGGEVILTNKPIAHATADPGGGGGGGDMNSNLNKLKAIASSFVPNSPSSEEDNSPTEMNNCRRIMEKPPLVKRLTMGLLMKTAEDSRPLVYNTHNHHSSGLQMQQLNNNCSNNNNSNNHSNNNSNNNNQNNGHPGRNCDGYVNEAVCDRDRVVNNKFGDSCRQSLTTIQHQLDNNHNHEFNFKKNLLRETSSGKFFY